MSIHPNRYKKYVLMGGYITSKSDGDTHWIGADQLCQLYGLNQNLCFFCDPRLESTIYGINMGKMIVLGPRFHGDYKEHLEAMERSK